MQIEIFTICDSAQVYSGKAVVVGAFNQLIAKTLPVQIPNLTLAVRVTFEKGEAGDKTFYFFLNNPDGSQLIPELRFDAKQGVPLEKQDPLTTFDMNIVLGNVPLKQFGVYTVTMKVDGKESLLKFFVQEDKKLKPQ